jgi:hypothetical protein
MHFDLLYTVFPRLCAPIWQLAYMLSSYVCTCTYACTVLYMCPTVRICRRCTRMPGMRNASIRHVETSTGLVSSFWSR